MRPNIDRREINRINLTLNKLIKKIGKSSLKFYKDNYNKQGDFKKHFIKWAKLKQSTIDSKRRRGTLRKGILKDSGALYRSLKIQSYGFMKVVLGTDPDLGYGVHHQTGIPGKMDQREYLYHSDELNKENIKEINKVILPLFKIKTY
jgi:phage gpG-like protein